MRMGTVTPIARAHQATFKAVTAGPRGLGWRGFTATSGSIFMTKTYSGRQPRARAKSPQRRGGGDVPDPGRMLASRTSFGHDRAAMIDQHE